MALLKNSFISIFFFVYILEWVIAIEMKIE